MTRNYVVCDDLDLSSLRDLDHEIVFNHAGDLPVFHHSNTSMIDVLSCERDHEMVRRAPLNTRSDSALIDGALSTSRAC
jgi:hypothetical protein